MSSNWFLGLSAQDKADFDVWIQSGDARHEFRVWQDERRVHLNGNPFYGRTWDDHFARCKETGRDPYD